MSGRQLLVYTIFILTFIITFSCREAGDKNAADELMQKQKKALLEEKAKVSGLIGEMEATGDSLRQSYEQNQKEKMELKERLKELDTKRHSFEQEKSEDELKKLTQEKQKFTEQLLAADRTLSVVKDRLADLQKEGKAIENRMVYVSESEQITKQTIRSEMTSVDSNIINLEKEKQIEQKKIPVLQKKISISSIKIQAYQEEKDLFEELKTNKIRENASEGEIDALDKKILEIGAETDEEHLKLTEVQMQIANSENRIVEIDSQLQKLNQLVRDKYDTKEVVTDFIGKQTARLRQDKEKNHTETLLLKDQENIFNKEKEFYTKRIAELDEKIEILTGREVDNLKAQQDRLTSVSPDEDVRILDQANQQSVKSVQDTSLQKLSRISEEAVREKAKRSQKQAELSVAQSGNLNTKTDVSENKVQNYMIWGYTTTIFIALAIGTLVVLYFIGKSVSRKKRK